MLKTIIGIAGALILFLIVYQFIDRFKKGKEETVHYVCDVCKENICDCHQVEENSS